MRPEPVRAPTTQPIFCSLCGTRLRGGRFCVACGASIDRAATVRSPAAPANADEVANRVIGGVVLGAGIVIVFAAFLPWIKVSAPLFGSVSASGVRVFYGWGACIGGAFVAYTGVRLLAGQRGRGTKAASICNSLCVLALAAVVAVELSNALEQTIGARG